MCGIVGYVGARPALSILVDGLRRLEYRGYDSAGIAVLDGDRLLTERRAGKLANLEKALAEARTGELRASATARPASGTPAGRPTAARPIATRTRTARPTAGSP